MKLGTIVKQLRREQQLTQVNLAKKANVLPCIISRIESGRGCTLHSLDKILSALDHELEVVPING